MLFSVIIPAARRNRPLSHAISSLLLQNYDRWEALIVGDELFHRSSSQIPHDHRIRFIARPTISTYEACTIGIQAARGDMITFLLPDDYISPTHLELQYDFLRSHPHLDALFGKPTVLGSPYYENTFNHTTHHVHREPVLGTSFIREQVFDTIDTLPRHSLRSQLAHLGFTTHTITMPTYVYDRTSET